MKEKRESEMKDRIGRKLSFSKLKTGVSLAALASSVALFIILVQIEKNVLTQYEKGEVYIASQGIPKGQMITEENYQEYFMVKEMDKSLIPQTALTKPFQVEGLSALYDVEPGTFLTMGMFEELGVIWQDMTEPVIAGFRVEDIYQAAGGTLRAGDRIHIYVVKEEGACLAWEGIYVQQVFDASGGIIPNTDQSTAAQRINIYLDKKDIINFYTGMAEGNLLAVKLCE